MRTIDSSARLRDALIALCAALALAAAFPKINAAWLAPAGAAALFWTATNASYKRAVILGWFAGIVYFSISFSWFATTVGAYVGPFWPAVIVLPAMLEGLAFAAFALLTRFAANRTPPALLPLAGACAFTLCEWARSVGVLGAPFAQVGYSQANTPLVIFAAYIGTYGVTFIVCLLGFTLADALRRKTWKLGALTYLGVASALLIAWSAWPARHAAPPTIPVAAIQGNITQTLKWQPGSLQTAINRYISLTHAARPQHPRLILWPETVITTQLNADPSLLARFGALARSMHATLVVGSLLTDSGGIYNALYIFNADGALDATYKKRQLVPFAESFPGQALLSWLPYIGSLNGGFSSGQIDGVYDSNALPFAPLICWESAFADLTHAQIHRGAQMLVIATDDAWFGTSAGPYAHAEIAQLRAVETGTWVLRAASTGISGIIAPTGQYVEHSQLETQAVITGMIGTPPGAPFAWYGPTPVIVLFAFIYVMLIILPRKDPVPERA